MPVDPCITASWSTPLGEEAPANLSQLSKSRRRAVTLVEKEILS